MHPSHDKLQHVSAPRCSDGQVGITGGAGLRMGAFAFDTHRVTTGQSPTKTTSTEPSVMRSDYCFVAVHRPVHPSDCRKDPEPLRPESRPVVTLVSPLEPPVA